MMLLHRQQKGVFFIMKRFYFSLVVIFISFAIAFLSDNLYANIIFTLLGIIAIAWAIHSYFDRKKVLQSYKLVCENYENYKEEQERFYSESMENHHEIFQDQENEQTLKIQRKKLEKIEDDISKEISRIYFFNGLNYLSREKRENLKRIPEEVLSKGGE